MELVPYKNSGENVRYIGGVAVSPGDVRLVPRNLLPSDATVIELADITPPTRDEEDLMAVRSALTGSLEVVLGKIAALTLAQLLIAKSVEKRGEIKREINSLIKQREEALGLDQWPNFANDPDDPNEPGG